MATPTTPYRGIQPFRYADHAIFFARERETRVLTSLVDVYRGVLLYGDSGTGKSSLVNAGLLPVADGLGFEPVRVRVQPRAGEELVIEQIVISDDSAEVLPCVLAPETGGAARVVLSIAEFEDRVNAASREHQPLIIFDQFEEILTLFEDAAAATVRAELVEMIVRLLREALPVKLLFSFREDHLGRVKQLLAAQPSLVDQALRLGPPSAGALTTIIRGPFERFPGRYERELDPALAQRLSAALAERFGSGDVSLSEVQTVCLRLWRSADPEALLAAKGVQGLLEDELGEALDMFAPEMRHAAIALLSQMVTSAGTRNVVSAEDLRQRVAAEDADIPPALVGQALDRLERESKLVRRERRRDIYLYEITSEFLVPWISRRREEARLAQQRRRDEEQHQQERAREHRRLRAIGSVAAALIVVVAVVAWLAVQARNRSVEANRQAATAMSLALSTSATPLRNRRPDLSLLLASAAYEESPRLEARANVLAALTAVRASGVVGILHGHADSVSSVAFGPDGHTLASASDDGTIRLWDTRTRRPLGRALRGHRGAVHSVAFSADGRLLASGGGDEMVRLWDARTGKQLGEPLTGHAGIVYGVAFSPDGRMLASGGQDGTVRLWGVNTREQLGDALRGHMDSVRSVAFSSDGRTLASTGEDETIRLWDAPAHRSLGRMRGRGHDGAVYRVAFSPDARTLASAGSDGTVRLWDVRRRRQRGSPLRGHEGFVRSVTFGADGRTLASAGDDHTVRLWDARSHERLGPPLRGHDSAIHDVALSADGHTLAAAGDDETIRLWDTSSPPALRGHALAVRSVAFSPDGRTLASASEDATVRLWNARTHTALGSELRGHRGVVHSVGFASDGRTLASAGEDQTVRIWDARTGKPSGSPLRAGDRFTSAAFSGKGPTVALGGGDGTIRFWDVRTRAPQGSLRAHRISVTVVALSRDGRTLASAGADDRLRLWDARSHKPLGKALTGHVDFVYGVAFSPDGRTLASAGEDKTIRLWDVRTQREIAQLRAHTKAVLSVAFSADGRTLASSGDDLTVRLWDVRERRQLGPSLRGQGDDSVVSLAFTPDGRTLAAASRDGTIRLWDRILWRTDDELRREVCGLVGADLSKMERARYASGIPYSPTCR